MTENEPLSAASEYLRRCVSREQSDGAGQVQRQKLSLEYYGKGSTNTLKVEFRGPELWFSVGDYQRLDVFLGKEDVQDLVKELTQWLRRA